MLKKILIMISLFLSSIVISNVFADDALDQAFSDSKDYQLVTTKVNDKHVESWVQNTEELMLKITVMIGVAVFLFGGIRFMLSFGDDSKAKKARDNLIISAIGFVIAFGAWTILNLIMSAGTTLRTEFLFYLI